MAPSSNRLCSDHLLHSRGGLLEFSERCSEQFWWWLQEMRLFSAHAEQLQAGTVVLTATQPIVSEHYLHVSQCMLGMSWGDTAVYVQAKLPV